MRVLLAAAAAALLCQDVRGEDADGGRRPKVGAIPLPEMGHYNPMRPILEQLALRGYQVEIYAPRSFAPCREQFGGIPCVPYPEVAFPFNDKETMQGVVMQPFFESMLTQIEHVMDIHRDTLPVLLQLFRSEGFVRPDLLLVDFAMMSGLSVAAAFSIQTAAVFPLSLSLPYWNEPWVPTLGTMFPLNMSLRQRLANYALQKLALLSDHPQRWDAVGARHGVPPLGGFRKLMFQRTIIAPSMPPLAVAQPHCPNMHSVGFLLPDESGPLPPEYADWLQSCPEGVVYVNLGSIAVVPDADSGGPLGGLLDRMERGLRQTGLCVLWKLKGAARRAAGAAAGAARFRVEEWLPFHPVRLLRHPLVRVFLTHCGDTSVMEALSVGVPLVGLPLFVDQGDVCARVVDAQLGLAADKFTVTAAEIRDKVLEVANARRYRERAQWIAELSASMRGPQRAADIVEMVLRFGDEHTVCNLFRLSDWEYFQVDILLVFTVLPLLLALGCLYCCCCRQGKGLRRIAALCS